MNIQINVKNKRATVVGSPVIVCGNSGYKVQFLFDEEWNTDTAKTARFVYVRTGSTEYEDVEIVGDTAEVPMLSNVREVRVGAYMGDIRATTPAIIPCELSVRCAEVLATNENTLF